MLIISNCPTATIIIIRPGLRRPAIAVAPAVSNRFFPENTIEMPLKNIGKSDQSL